VKGTYPISAILRKLFKIDFCDTFPVLEISTDGHRQAQERYQDRRPVPPLGISPSPPDPSRDPYVKYQRELQAGRLVSESSKPSCPGTVLKLPLTELKPLSKQHQDADNDRHPGSPPED
jgi:hypothetical protein